MEAAASGRATPALDVSPSAARAARSRQRAPFG